LKLVEVLDNDIKKLRHDISIFQSHMQKTELWCDNIGKFTTNVTAQIEPQPSEPHVLALFEIHVQLHERFDIVDLESESEQRRKSSPAFKEGWVIYRSLKEFEQLNDNLSDLLPTELRLKFKKIPGLLKKGFSKANEERQERARLILDEYLRIISEDESLAQSEALYTFLCPSPGYFKKDTELAAPTDEKFSLANIFRGGGSSKTKELSEDEYLENLFSDTNLKLMLDTNARDSIAEPFYRLIEEIFGLKSMRKWFRKSLILFVQLTYGATINRKIRETIYWALSNDMLAFYFKQVKDSFWTMNEASGRVELISYEAPVRTKQEKLNTKKLAREKLVASIPETMQRLIGEKNAQIGVVKLFDLFQDKKLNKHLIYVSF
jgi:sorting nexin-25